MIPKIDLFERNSSFSRMTSCNYWKVIPQFVPLNGLHADILVLRIGAVQAERVYIFVHRSLYGKKHCMRNWKVVYSIEPIELAKSFLLKYRY